MNEFVIVPILFCILFMVFKKPWKNMGNMGNMGGMGGPRMRNGPPEKPDQPKESAPPKNKDARKCPNCGAELSELNFYKLKAGDNTKCEYCNVIISSDS